MPRIELKAGWAWWYTSVISVGRGLRQEDREFEANLVRRSQKFLKKPSAQSILVVS
jgi:hypothetical protein